MMAVQKKSGDVRICVDLKPLNESVLREIHPLPKVDDVLTQLSGATVFSKLDANSGFWQIPLDPSSRHLTTFLKVEWPISGHSLARSGLHAPSAKANELRALSVAVTDTTGYTLSAGECWRPGSVACKQQKLIITSNHKSRKMGLN